MRVKLNRYLEPEQPRLLDVCHTVFICQGIWHYLVLNWGNTAELDVLSWTIAVSVLLEDQTRLNLFDTQCSSVFR